MKNLVEAEMDIPVVSGHCHGTSLDRLVAAGRLLLRRHLPDLLQLLLAHFGTLLGTLVPFGLRLGLGCRRSRRSRRGGCELDVTTLQKKLLLLLFGRTAAQVRDEAALRRGPLLCTFKLGAYSMKLGNL